MAEDVFDRAVGYPYSIPDTSYVYHNGSYTEVDAPSDWTDVSGLTPVLAVGSNQSPQQLARKFPGSDWAPIPVSKVSLKDFDTVYSAHITAYGSIAATLFAVPGTTVTLFVNWLDEAHLRRMHETELGNENYEFGKLTGIELDVEFGSSMSEVSLYHGLRGIYAPNGNPIPLAEVKTINRQHDDMTQHQVLTHIRDRLSPEAELEEFVREAATDRAVRQSRTESIGEGRLIFSYEGYVPSAL
jgi:hypothetical protein